MNPELEKYKAEVAARLGSLSPYLAHYALGDFSKEIQVPDIEDEFTELTVALNLMVDDIQEMIGEREESIEKLTKTELALRHSEDLLRNRLEMIQLMFEISNKFLTLSLDNLDGEINITLARIAKFVGAKRSSLFLLSDDQTTITNTHEWCTDAGDSQIEYLQELPFETFGYSAQLLNKHETIAIATFEDLPLEAKGERQWAEEHGFRSLLFVPLLSLGKLIGAIGFYGEVGDHIDWPQLFVQLLRVIGDIFANTFNRKKTEEILASRMEEMGRFNRMAVGREHQMIKLKQQVNQLSQELGKDLPFDLKFINDGNE